MKLTEDNIRMILDTLIYDGRVEVEVVSGGGSQGEEGSSYGRDSLQRLYRVSKPVLLDTGFSRIPCGICPVSGGEGGGWVLGIESQDYT